MTIKMSLHLKKCWNSMIKNSFVINKVVIPVFGTNGWLLNKVIFMQGPIHSSLDWEIFIFSSSRFLPFQLTQQEITSINNDSRSDKIVSYITNIIKWSLLIFPHCNKLYTYMTSQGLVAHSCTGEGLTPGHSSSATASLVKSSRHSTTRTWLPPPHVTVHCGPK